jgi:hypothetical protein
MLTVSSLAQGYDNPGSLLKTVKRCDQDFLLQENPSDDTNCNLSECWYNSPFYGNRYILLMSVPAQEGIYYD